MQNSQAVLSVKFNSIHHSAELIQLFKQDLDLFKAVPGLVQKYYIAGKLPGPTEVYMYLKTKRQGTHFWTQTLQAKSPPCMA